MRRFVIAAFVVAAACSDDGVPLDEGTSSAEETGDDDADTISSTVTLDSTDTSSSMTGPSGTTGESITTTGDTTDPSSATAESESTSLVTDAESSSDAGETSTTDETSATDETSSTGGGPTTTDASSSSSDAESESSGGNAPLCGDGIVQGAEECDNDDFGDNESCVDLGYTAGVLACNPGSCQYDESDCNDEPAYDIDFCRLQFPTSVMGDAGDSVDVFGRVYVGGLTDQSQMNDPAANVEMQVGWGEDGSDPTDEETWAWFPAGPNAGYGPGSPGFEMNNDEYTGAMILPAAGEWDFAVRFTGDGGATWSVCDGGDAGSSDGYAPANAGQLSTQ